jgi:hypothetical protein
MGTKVQGTLRRTKSQRTWESERHNASHEPFPDERIKLLVMTPSQLFKIGFYLGDATEEKDHALSHGLFFHPVFKYHIIELKPFPNT